MPCNSARARVDARRSSFATVGISYVERRMSSWAVVTLPERVRELLKSIPLETDSVGPDRPFLQTGVSAETSTHLWRRRFSTICKLANITEIRTATGTQAPHPHALRDTFAVGKLRATRGNVKAVARMLGHANSVITEKTYLPWVKELDDAHLEICDEALVHDRALLSAERGEKEPYRSCESFEVVEMGDRRSGSRFFIALVWRETRTMTDSGNAHLADRRSYLPRAIMRVGDSSFITSGSLRTERVPCCYSSPKKLRSAELCNAALTQPPEHLLKLPLSRLPPIKFGWFLVIVYAPGFSS